MILGVSRMIWAAILPLSYLGALQKLYLVVIGILILVVLLVAVDMWKVALWVKFSLIPGVSRL